jgi:predicted Zn-dependent peptidase
MLSITKIKNSSKTTKYFAKDDSYTNNDSNHLKSSFWYGQGAQELNLENHVSSEKFQEKEVETIIQNMSGSHPFKFEENKSFVQHLSFFDHLGKSYDDLYNFPKIIKNIHKNDISRITKNAFNWNRLYIIVFAWFIYIATFNRYN